jgi:hypothetical protein
MFTKADIEKYFLAEKNLSILFMVLGGLAVISALVFFLGLKTNFYKGAAIPLLLIGLFHFAVSYTGFKKADDDRKTNVYSYDMNPSNLIEKELPRIDKLSQKFNYFLVVETLLVITGIGLFVYFKNDSSKLFWMGLGLTLAIEAALTFGADMYAKKLAQSYSSGLKVFSEKKY